MSDIQPNLQQLIEELQTIRTKWQLFGVFLGVPKDELDAIDENKRNVEDKLYALFCKWTEIQPRGTWQDIMKALKKIKRLDVAEILEKKYIKHHLPSSDTSYCKSESMSLSPQNQSVDSSPGPTELDDNTCTDKAHVDVPKYLMQDVDDLASQFTYLLTKMQSALQQQLIRNELDLDQLGRFISNTFCVSYVPFCAFLCH